MGGAEKGTIQDEPPAAWHPQSVLSHLISPQSTMWCLRPRAKPACQATGASGSIPKSAGLWVPVPGGLGELLGAWFCSQLQYMAREIESRLSRERNIQELCVPWRVRVACFRGCALCRLHGIM